MSKDGSPKLRISTTEGSTLAELMVYSDEALRLSFAKNGGTQFFFVGVAPNGSSRLELLDEDGRPRTILKEDEHASPGLLLVDRLGQP